MGNRTVMTDTSGTISYSYDNANRLQSAGSASYTWDANGNLKTKVTPGGTISYTYDYADRLKRVVTGTNTYLYSYNGDGIRLRKT